MKTIVGYKGFDKDFKCQGFQYEVGKEYKEEIDPKVCSNGFHFCEIPLSVFSYYPIIDGNQYALIEANGEIDTEDDKSSTDNILIKSKVDIAGMIKASVDIIWNKAKEGEIFKRNSATSGDDAHSATSGDDAHSATSGDGAHSATSGNYAHSATSGYGAHSATSGDDAHSATSGDYAHSATSGNRANSATSGYGAHSATTKTDNSIACAIGRKAKAKASLGCFIVLAEWKEGKSFTDAKPIGVISAKVDGKKIKADQWYKAVKGKFVETDDSND